MKRKNAFTLIELLAVIVILAIIALIATPLTINVINSAKEKSFVNTIYGLIDEARLLSAQQLFAAGSNEVVVNFQDGEADNTNFQVSGELPNQGTVHLNSDGKVELKVWSEELGKCAEKSTTESAVKFTETSKEECKLDIEPQLVFPATFEAVMSRSNEVLTQDPEENMRYAGADPNNYIEFNGELWRIIGLFGEEGNLQAKIIRNERYKIGENIGFQWDGNSEQSWLTSTLVKRLNSATDGNCLLSDIENNSTDYNYIDLDHVWNLGALDVNADPYGGKLTDGTRSEYYIAERGDLMPGGAQGSLTWEGAIALMYASDYGYSTTGSEEICGTNVLANWGNSGEVSVCKDNSWLYDKEYPQWILNSDNDFSNYSYYIQGPAETLGSLDLAYKHNYFSIYPTLYLEAGVKIAGGEGTSQQPYRLTM